MTRFLLLSDSCWFVDVGRSLSLTRERVCRLQLLLALASADIFGSGSHGTRDHNLLSQIRDFHFRRLLRLAGLRWRYSAPPTHAKSITYKSSVRTSQETLRHHNNDQPFRESIAIYCENHAKDTINTLCGQNGGQLNAKTAGTYTYE
jgi:hypothetical protein